jgi:hypothetical protein
MKFPSLIRLPRNKRFEVSPRYYDPIKEEIEERTRRIKQEMESGNAGEYVPGRISFERKTESVPSTSLIQLGIAALLGIMVVGWLFYGGQFFYYVLYAAIPIYIYFRFIRKRSKN